jgi:hypothetical protein
MKDNTPDKLKIGLFEPYFKPGDIIKGRDGKNKMIMKLDGVNNCFPEHYANYSIRPCTTWVKKIWLRLLILLTK